MLNEVLDPAREVGAQLVENVCLDIRPVLVDQLRKRHSAQVRGSSNLLQLHPPALAELEFGDPLLELES